MPAKKGTPRVDRSKDIHAPTISTATLEAFRQTLVQENGALHLGTKDFGGSILKNGTDKFSYTAYSNWLNLKKEPHYDPWYLCSALIKGHCFYFKSGETDPVERVKDCIRQLADSLYSWLVQNSYTLDYNAPAGQGDESGAGSLSLSVYSDKKAREQVELLPDQYRSGKDISEVFPDDLKKHFYSPFILDFCRIAKHNSRLLVQKGKKENAPVILPSPKVKLSMPVPERPKKIEHPTSYGVLSVYPGDSGSANLISILCQQLDILTGSMNLPSFSKQFRQHYDQLNHASMLNYLWSVYQYTIRDNIELIRKFLGSDYVPPYEAYMASDNQSPKKNKPTPISQQIFISNLFQARTRDYICGFASLNVIGDESYPKYYLGQTLFFILFISLLFKPNDQIYPSERSFGENRPISVQDSFLAHSVAIQVSEWFHNYCTANHEKLSVEARSISMESDSALSDEIMGIHHSTTSGDHYKTSLPWMLWVILEGTRLYRIPFTPPFKNITSVLITNHYAEYLYRVRDSLNRLPGTLHPDSVIARKKARSGSFIDPPVSDLLNHYVFQSFGEEDEKGARKPDSRPTIFDAFPDDDSTPVRLVLSRNSGWGKTTTLKLLACNYGYSDIHFWVRNELEKLHHQNIDACLKKAGYNYRPVYMRVGDGSSTRIFGSESSDRAALFSQFLFSTLFPGSDSSKAEYNNVLLDGFFSEARLNGARPLLLIDDLDKFSAAHSRSKHISVDRARSEFLSCLEAFLKKRPECGCVITSLTPLRMSQPLLFRTIYPLSFTRNQTTAYCRKWFAMSDRSSAEAEQFAQTLMQSYSMRRIMRRPLFANYVMAVETRTGISPFYKSSYTLLKTMAANIRLFTDKINSGIDINLVTKEDILYPISYIAFELQDACNSESSRGDAIHIPLDQLRRLIERAQKAIGHLISSSSPFAVMGTEELIAFLRTISVLKFDYAETDEGEPTEVFSFSSRPLLWYFSAYGLWLKSQISTRTMLRYISQHMATRCDEQHAGYQDEWIYMVAYAVRMAHSDGWPVIEYLCKCTFSSAAKNRGIRNVCIQILSKLIPMMPMTQQEHRELMYRSTFMRYFEVFQTGDLWSILRSPARDEFISYAYDKFSKSALSAFPRFCWLIGWLDWVSIASGATGESNPPVSSLAHFYNRNFRRPDFADLLSCTPGNKEQIIVDLLEYIKREIKSHNGITEDLVRAVLMLSSVFWLLAFNQRQYRVGRLDDEPALEDELNISLPLLAHCAHVMLSLLDIREGCVASIACYALSHIFRHEVAEKSGLVQKMIGDQELVRIILADHFARSSCTTDENYEHDVTFHPLEGSITLLSTFDLAREKPLSDPEYPTDEAAEFYRLEWERLSSDSDNDRMRALIFPICALLGIWDRETTAVNADELIQIYENSLSDGRKYLLEKDKPQELMARIHYIAKKHGET